MYNREKIIKMLSKNIFCLSLIIEVMFDGLFIMLVLLYFGQWVIGGCTFPPYLMSLLEEMMNFEVTLNGRPRKPFTRDDF